MEVFSFSAMSTPMPFLTGTDKIYRKKFGILEILLNFAVRVGADGKERLR